LGRVAQSCPAGEPTLEGGDLDSTALLRDKPLNPVEVVTH
jgi:hypothetical protein